MRLEKTSAVSLLFPLVLLLLVGLLAGCGGDQSGSNQSGSGGQEQKQTDKAAGKAAEKKEPLPRKMAIGTVRAFKDDKRRLSLRPVADAQGKKPLGFKVRKNAQITLDGKKADLGDIEADQQAQIAYVVKNDVNRAVVVQLFNEQPPEGNKPKKQPSKDAGKNG